MALRLASEREDEIDAFKPQEYWSVDVQFRGPDGKVRGQAVPLHSSLSRSPAHVNRVEPALLVPELH